MTDMNKIPGGTEEQRKIAQERQKRREAKEKGFDSNKSVMADGSKPSEKATNTSSAITKTNVPAPKGGALVKSEPKSLPSDKGGALAKTEPKPLVKKDKRKSEMGKWSQGIKNVKVKVDDPKTNKPPTVTPAKGNTSTPVPDKTYQPTGKRPEEEVAKKKKKKKGQGFSIPQSIKDLAQYKDQSVGTSGG